MSARDERAGNGRRAVTGRCGAVRSNPAACAIRRRAERRRTSRRPRLAAAGAPASLEAEAPVDALAGDMMAMPISTDGAGEPEVGEESPVREESQVREGSG